MSYDYSKHYKKWHSTNENHFKQMAEEKWSLVEQYIPNDKNSKILDFGCGFGFLVKAYTDHGFRSVTGVDISAEQVAVGNKYDLNLIYSEDSEHWLKTRKDSFDFISLIDVLEHIPKDKQIAVVESLFASLKPGGRMMVIVPNASSILASRWLHIDFTHSCSYTEYALSFVLECGGFDKIIFAPSHTVRPSVRFWNRDSRRITYKYFLRKFWRKILEIEQPYEDFSSVSLDLNITAICIKT